MKLRPLLFTFLIFFLSFSLQSQSNYWQQHVSYVMNIDFDVDNHQFTGTQELTYTNNSPDTIKRVFYHLYLNAFQPNSMMDVRSRTIIDPDRRVMDRIQGLDSKSIGYQKIDELTQDGLAASYLTEGTILEVDLPKPILPGTSTVLKMKFNAQISEQIRRTGRNNKEGIAYSMAQWYPKLSEYDEDGWHANPYVGREFHGVWGDFDVKITIDRDYLVAATGYLQNAREVGGGYEGITEGTEEGPTKTYHFLAPNVIDFVWAADPDYTHTVFERKDGMKMHFFYQVNEKTTESWEHLPAIVDKVFDYVNENFGQYPYQQYSFIQGGDRGMEYPMATLITGERSFSSLLGTSIHEILHSWYQSVLATNESLYPWMDEGFATYAGDEVLNYLRRQGLVHGDAVDDPHQTNLTGFINFVKNNYDEALSTHDDHYTTNAAHSVGAYIKGALFLYQLQYIVGKQTLNKTLLKYYNTWKFKHPDADDFMRIIEEESGMELDWFKQYFINTRHLADYGITNIEEDGRKNSILSLEKIGIMPMPVDVTIKLKNDEKIHYTIPLRMMRSQKMQEGTIRYKTAPDWPWTHPTYELKLDIPYKRILSIEIDESQRMIDTNRDNNSWTKE